MKITEHNFIQQMSRGNEKALEYVMLHYGGLVKSVVHRYLYSLSQYEEECINDIFYAVWSNITSYQPEKNPFANWIAGVARIKALDYKRKYVRQLQEVSWEDAEFSQGALDSQMEETIRDIQEEFSAEMKQMLSCLKPKDQELFLKLYVEEQSLEAVSAQSGLSKPVIYNRVSRAKKKIRNLYPREEKDRDSSRRKKEGNL